MEKVGKFYRKTLVNNIKEGFQANKNTFLLSYSALSGPQLNSLRKELKRVGAKVFASKNRIAQVALKELKQETLADSVEGQTAFVWSNADCAEVAKALVKFSGNWENLVLKGGLVDGALLQKADIKRLSDLPSRNVLLAELLRVMIAPVTRLAGDMNAKSRDLLSILKQLSEKGGN